MPSAILRLRLGPKAKDYVRILGKGKKYKRGSLTFKAGTGTVDIRVEADDAIALLASVSSAVKQLKVVSDVDSLFTKQHTKHK
ncbi:MAG: hypothetical protein KGH57_01720 [Candidatus Micrarchaeota archaeon]|nr:hypothetical protein [Candidatus Micrarchaeota archaeon]